MIHAKTNPDRITEVCSSRDVSLPTAEVPRILIPCDFVDDFTWGDFVDGFTWGGFVENFTFLDLLDSLCNPWVGLIHPWVELIADDFWNPPPVLVLSTPQILSQNLIFLLASLIGSVGYLFTTG